MDSHKRHHRKVVGIDLAGSPKRSTGICTLKKDNLTFCTILHTDQEIVSIPRQSRGLYDCWPLKGA